MGALIFTLPLLIIYFIVKFMAILGFIVSLICFLIFRSKNKKDPSTCIKARKVSKVIFIVACVLLALAFIDVIFGLLGTISMILGGLGLFLGIPIIFSFFLIFLLMCILLRKSKGTLYKISKILCIIFGIVLVLACVFNCLVFSVI